MISRPPANASERCGAETATITDASDSGTTPTRCSAAAAHSPCRAIAVRHDGAELRERHLRVGLVLERRHFARDAREGHDRSGAWVAYARDKRVERQQAVDERDVRLGAPRHRRDQRQLVAGQQRRVCGRVLAVDGHHERQPVGERRDRRVRQRVAHARALGQLERQLARARALAQHGEEADAHDHRAQGTRRVGGRR